MQRYSARDAREKAETARALQSYVDQHGRVPRGAVPPDVLKENSAIAFEKISEWLDGWHGRDADKVNVYNFRLFQLPHKYLEYQVPFADRNIGGVRPSCTSCQMVGRHHDVEGQWVVRRNNRCACISVPCMQKLFSNSQSHDAVKYGKEKKRKAARTDEAVRTDHDEAS